MLVHVLELAPLAAAGFAVPQFLPQLFKVYRSRDAAGVSWSWAALTSLNNAAWVVYFVLSGLWTALVPACSATLLAGVLAGLLTRHGALSTRGLALTTVEAGLLAGAFGLGGRVWLGTALTAAFVLQVTPSVWTAYRTRRPTGISSGTWLLILGELSCFAVYGLDVSDPRLTVLGCTGITASILMLARIASTVSRSTDGNHCASAGRCGSAPRPRAGR